jgi:hypothetical protein
MLDELRVFQSTLLEAIHGINEAGLRRPERPGRWSILEVIAHLSDLELMCAVRFRLILATDRPTLQNLDQQAWVARVHEHDSRDEILEQFWFLRRLNLSLLEGLDETQRRRAGMHPLFGEMTIDDIAAMLTRHQAKHLSQIEEIKRTLGLSVSTRPWLEGVVSARPEDAPVRSPGHGVRVRTLWQNGIRRALQVEIDAGAQWPGIDYHVPGPEEVLVVSGDYDDGVGVYGAGTFLHHPAGSSHSPRSEKGCVLLVYYPEG